MFEKLMDEENEMERRTDEEMLVINAEVEERAMKTGMAYLWRCGNVQERGA